MTVIQLCTVMCINGDTWKTTRSHADCMRQKVLRKIYGPVQDSDIHRIKTNHELINRPITSEVKCRVGSGIFNGWVQTEVSRKLTMEISGEEWKEDQ